MWKQRCAKPTAHSALITSSTFITKHTHQQTKEVDVHRRVQEMFAQHVEFYRAHLFTRAH